MSSDVLSVEPNVLLSQGPESQWIYGWVLVGLVWVAYKLSLFKDRCEVNFSGTNLTLENEKRPLTQSDGDIGSGKIQSCWP